MVLENLTYYIVLIVICCLSWSIFCSCQDVSIGNQLIGHVVIFTVISWLFTPLIAEAMTTCRGTYAEQCRPI